MLNDLERAMKWAAGLMALVSLTCIYLGIGRGLRRPVAPGGGIETRLIRSPLFYLVTSLLFFGLGVVLWKPIPVKLSAARRWLALALGALLSFPGLALVLWGRLTLGKFYNASSSLGAPLYADHQLITGGPYALVRHPMYLGLFLAALGGVFIYRTWTLVFLLVCSLGLLLRAWREEQALANRFGEAWQAYARRVPAWFPLFRQKRS